MPMKPLYAGLITAAAIVGAILICVGCRRCQRAISNYNVGAELSLRFCVVASILSRMPRTVNGTGHIPLPVGGLCHAIDATFSRAGRCYRTRDYDDGKARRYIPGITDEENALVDEQYYHDRTSGQEGQEF